MVPPGAHGRKVGLLVPAISKFIREINKWKAKITETAEVWKGSKLSSLQRIGPKMFLLSQNALITRHPQQDRNTEDMEPIHHNAAYPLFLLGLRDQLFVLAG